MSGPALALHFLARCWFEPPSAAWLEALAANELLEEWPIHSDDDHTIRGLDLLRAQLRVRGETAIDELVWDFNRLFVGPGEMKAPPWESVHRSKQGLTFQQETLQVRDLYRRYGLEAPGVHREPDDHIAFELTFLAHLCECAANATDPEERLEHQATQRAFLEEHLLTWAPGLFELVEQHARADYFRGVSYLTSGTLREIAG